MWSLLIVHHCTQRKILAHIASIIAHYHCTCIYSYGLCCKSGEEFAAYYRAREKHQNKDG